MKTQHSTGCHFALHLSPTVQTVRWRMLEIARSLLSSPCASARARARARRKVGLEGGRVKIALVLYGSLSPSRSNVRAEFACAATKQLRRL